MTPVKFEWDANKDAENRLKHMFHFSKRSQHSLTHIVSSPETQTTA